MAVGGYMLDMKADGFGVVELAYHAAARHADPITDNLYLVLDDYTDQLPVSGAFTPVLDSLHLYQFDSDETALLPYLWRGKLNLLPEPTTFTIAQVKAEDYDQLQLLLYADGAVFYQDYILDQNEFTIPMPDAYVTFEIEVRGTSRVRPIQVGEDVMELT